jgi:hypothetical protein
VSDIAKMRRILGRKGDLSSLSPEERDALLAGHRDTVDYESRGELEQHEVALEAVQAQAERASDDERTGTAVLRALRTLGLTGSRRPPPFGRVGRLLTTCTTLDPPSFTIQSPEAVTRNNTGGVVTFTRANASARTLELSAVTGEFGLARWPSSETFILGFNRSEASIGGILSIPAHGDGAVLTVSALLRVEHVQFDGSVTPGTAASLLNTIKGDGNLPLRGSAVGWCIAGLSLHGATGSVGTALKFVSEWINRDGGESTDQAAGGYISLANTVVVAPQTTSLSVFVDARAFSAAEESDELLSGFTSFECRAKPVEEINGIWTPPARLRLTNVSARLCELPILREIPPRKRTRATRKRTPGKRRSATGR